MEQFDRERQADIDRARRERPGDAQHLIDVAAPSGNRAGGGWNWAFDKPFVELALRYDVPLIAANLSTADAARIVRGGYAAVFSEPRSRCSDSTCRSRAEIQAAQEREIDSGHCHALPRSMWPRMAQAQYARDAVMADVLRRGARAAVSSCWRATATCAATSACRVGSASAKNKLFAVGYLEITDDSTPVSAFDAVVPNRVAERADPCAEFKKRGAVPA